MVEEFTPSSDEQNFIDSYRHLQRPHLNALPGGQRQLISMVMWKLLASSSFAIAGALNSIITRLEDDLEKDDAEVCVFNDLNEL